jgi:outer membrane protein TolC
MIAPHRRSRLCVLAAAASLAGCVAYEAAPIDPESTRNAFEARTLSDPELVTFARASLPAEAPFPPPIWTLDDLTVVALYDNPGIAVARAELAATKAGVVSASARPNPTLALDPEYVANAGGGLQSWVLGARLDVPIETAGKRDLRVERANRIVDAAELALYDAAWHVRSRLRGALLDHASAERDVQLLGEELGARRDALALLEQRFAVGDVSRPDLTDADIQRGRTELELRARTAHVRELRAQIAAALGVSVRALDGQLVAWPDVENPVPRPDLQSNGLESHDLESHGLESTERADPSSRLDVRRSLAEYAAAEAEVELEIAKQYPDVALGPGYTYDQGAHKFLIGFSMPIPIFNKNEGPIAEAEARRAAAQARFLALQAAAIGEIETAQARYAGAVEELAQAETVLARHRERERRLERAVAIGAEDRLALSEARVQSAVFARSRLEAAHRVNAALGDLEDALQRPLMGAGLLARVPVVDARSERR